VKANPRAAISRADASHNGRLERGGVGRSNRLMRTWILVGALAVSVAWAGEKPFQLNGVAERGQKTYQTYCFHCHGEKGDGQGHIARGLMTKPVDFTAPQTAAHLTDEFVYRLVRDGAAAHGRTVLMIPWVGVLTDAEIRDVSAYTLQLAAKAKGSAK
jgi:cytochrome c553